jgi:MinD-like ATPase involved in chromosome partitioning or flagellar assembly
MRVITCFSYKGGSGRTVAAANITAALASKRAVAAVEDPLNFKVALFDLDVFSAGTHRVFEIYNQDIQKREFSIQDYLMNEVSPADQIEKGGITLKDPLMSDFRDLQNADGNCRDDFTLFFSKPKPLRFQLAKYHENLLLELILELEKQGFDYAIIDGEAGTRAMADIAIRLSDVILMFYRPTWQHIDGTVKVAEQYVNQGKMAGSGPAVYLVPTCVPLVHQEDGVYQEDAPGLAQLRWQTENIPDLSGLKAFVQEAPSEMSYFIKGGLCIHDSLILKGGERVLVYDVQNLGDRAAADYYHIARELSRLHAPR